MTIKPQINGDTKLKHILPANKPSTSRSGEPGRRNRPGHEEVISAPRLHDDLHKAVRGDHGGKPRAGAFRRALPKNHEQPEPSVSKITIIKVIAAVVGILILFAGLVTAYTNQTSEDEVKEVTFEDEALMFFKDLLESEELGYGSEPMNGLFAARKVQFITAEDIDNELEPEFKFLIEIIDISDYPIKYTRSQEFRNEITNVDRSEIPEVVTSSGASPYNHYSRSGSELFLINSGVNIKVTDNEIHAAQLILLIWK